MENESDDSNYIFIELVVVMNFFKFSFPVIAGEFSWLEEKVLVNNHYVYVVPMEGLKKSMPFRHMNCQTDLDVSNSEKLNQEFLQCMDGATHTKQLSTCDGMEAPSLLVMIQIASLDDQKSVDRQGAIIIRRCIDFSTSKGKMIVEKCECDNFPWGRFMDAGTIPGLLLC